ncbi:MAG: hypothetical protein LBF51_10035 [Zoogloeaceae bacterium]|nr:hypothetical protein [Zoogloeaceae bacterium]
MKTWCGAVWKRTCGNVLFGEGMGILARTFFARANDPVRDELLCRCGLRAADSSYFQFTPLLPLLFPLSGKAVKIDVFFLARMNKLAIPWNRRKNA